MVWEKVNVRSVRARSVESAHRFNLRFRLLAGIQQWSVKRFDIVWAASEFRREELVNGLGVNPGKVRVIPNYIQLPPISSGHANRRSETGTLYILSAGRFAAHKRLDKTFQALAALGRDDVKLRLVGEGDSVEEQEVDGLIRELGLQDRVERLGKVPYNELIRLMQSSHVLLSTSEEEGFGVVFVEAMATGLPIVAMRLGAIPEVVPDQKAGFLVESGDIPQIVEKLKLILDDASLREAMSAFGQQYARRFDLEEHWTEFMDLYYEAVNKHQGRRGR
jgi:glycosyltransferase involved in cell wall biosynthesis